MEPRGTTSREWATATCRLAGFEPDVRYTTTDLQIQLRLVEEGLAVALLPALSGARTRAGVRAHRLEGRPGRQIFCAVRRGSAERPAVRAFVADGLGGPGGRGRA
jgi:DNA-binding transcriptional LysR family regulator